MKKHSILGIISIFMPAASFLIYEGFHTTIANLMNFNDTYNILAPVVSVFAFALPPLGLLLAIIAIVRRKRKLLFPVMGLAFNFVAICFEILFILMMLEIG